METTSHTPLLAMPSRLLQPNLYCKSKTDRATINTTTGKTPKLQGLCIQFNTVYKTKILTVGGWVGGWVGRSAMADTAKATTRLYPGPGYVRKKKKTLSTFFATPSQWNIDFNTLQ